MKCKPTSKIDLAHSIFWALALIMFAVLLEGHEQADNLFLFALLGYVTTQTVLSHRHCIMNQRSVSNEEHSE